ncbi:MAG: DUF1707 domain-containing protein [Actinomycetota bacterium]|nr:DUF1707 domain-containing protein [Actinomycetota bacterium]
MAMPSGLRIGDAEREAAAASLREHFALGRLTMEEFQQRLDAALTAKTDRDLARLTIDLPQSGTGQGAATGPGPMGGTQSGSPQHPAIGYRRRPGGSWVRFGIVIALVALVALPATRLSFGVFPGKGSIFILLLIAFLGRRALFRLLHPRRGNGRPRRPF